MLGDGYKVNAIGNGMVILINQLPSEKHKEFNVHHVEICMCSQIVLQLT